MTARSWLSQALESERRRNMTTETDVAPEEQPTQVRTWYGLSAEIVIERNCGIGSARRAYHFLTLAWSTSTCGKDCLAGSGNI